MDNASDATAEPGSVEILVHNVSHSDFYVAFQAAAGESDIPIIARPSFSNFRAVSAQMLATFSARVAAGRRVGEVTLPHKTSESRTGAGIGQSAPNVAVGFSFLNDDGSASPAEPIFANGDGDDDVETPASSPTAAQRSLATTPGSPSGNATSSAFRSPPMSPGLFASSEKRSSGGSGGGAVAPMLAPIELTLPQSTAASQSTSSSPAAAAAAEAAAAVVDPVDAGWQPFKLKNEQHRTCPRTLRELPRVLGIYFPLIALLVTKWIHISAGLSSCNDFVGSPRSKKVIYLVTGSGTPWNLKHELTGNSTKVTAQLIQKYLEWYFPDIETHVVDGGGRIFRYDANVEFVNKRLKPRIEEHRRRLAAAHADRWGDYFHLTVSLSDGAPARVAAINAAFREFKPDCLHTWRVKTFWHEWPCRTGISNADLEFHRFEKLEAAPSYPRSRLGRATQAITNEMVVHKASFEQLCEATANSKGALRNELGSFWLRKSKQPVLSVLMVQKSSQAAPIFFRGFNCEVSMPTGSLCAERNAIGTALATDPTLCRSDLKMIAVLAMGPIDAHGKIVSSGEKVDDEELIHMADNDDDDERETRERESKRQKKSHGAAAARSIASDCKPSETRNPIAPCGACAEWLKKIAEVNPDFKIITFTDSTCDRVYVRSVLGD
jgi:cytidine deaminase